MKSVTKDSKNSESNEKKSKKEKKKNEIRWIQSRNRVAMLKKNNSLVKYLIIA